MVLLNLLTIIIFPKLTFAIIIIIIIIIIVMITTITLFECFILFL
ncbi:MAG: hypothetical protein N7Q72_04830 [Spiroplasma sp. Tabriz.8]|nr:hypothetical protein [Candidatus Regiella insecticola]MCZ8632571.1 hypothetical protein [Spiroplasma sp. Tabriz.8]